MRALAAILLPILIGLAAVQPVAMPAPPLPAARADAFDHAEHASLFPTCTACHAGAEDPSLPFWPSPDGCASCHDGEVEERIEWRPPEAPPASNLRFAHDEHAAELLAEGRDAARCVDCHAAEGAPWMTIERAAVTRCLACHEIAASHLAAPDSACATCHLPLSDATALTSDDIEAFPKPPSHDELGFAARSGHGLLAWHPPAGGAPGEIAASCATCHARDFCAQCHVDAPEQPAIEALQPDRRSLVHEARVTEPPSHDQPGFLEGHGALVVSEPRECRTCHTQESCLACHAATPDRVVEMARAGPGRGPGAVIERKRPETHTPEFLRRGHGDLANVRPEACAGCHVRQDCLDCHRPGAARASGYHPPAFLARHPTAAYQRETSCSDCHSTQQFCADCHTQAGMAPGRPLTSGRFHDAKQFFVVGHGQAARQSLESCVTCHTERDCAQCHSATGARRFNPHGPGFDADRLRRRNPEPCRACHGVAIPGG